MRWAVLIIALTGIIVAWVAVSTAPEEVVQANSPITSHVYYTWDSLEVDRVACIWLIPRFIDPEAQIVFVAKDTVLQDATPFDIPNTPFARTARRSCFAEMVRHYQLDDPALRHLARLINKIELNRWLIEEDDEAKRMLVTINEILASEATRDEQLQATTEVLEAAHAELAAPPPRQS